MVQKLLSLETYFPFVQTNSFLCHPFIQHHLQSQRKVSMYMCNKMLIALRYKVVFGASSNCSSTGTSHITPQSSSPPLMCQLVVFVGLYVCLCFAMGFGCQQVSRQFDQWTSHCQNLLPVQCSPSPTHSSKVSTVKGPTSGPIAVQVHVVQVKAQKWPLNNVNTFF